MATIVMREVRPGEVPKDGGTAVQEDAGRPVFHGNGPDDYVCVNCGNLLAEGMEATYMTRRVRVRCGRCSTVNVAVGRQGDPAAQAAAKPQQRLAVALVGGRSVAVQGGDPDERGVAHGGRGQVA